MTVTISLSDTLTRRLQSEADVVGLPLADYATQVLEAETRAENLQPRFVEPSQEELERMFDALAEGGDDLPVLPPEAFEREALYEDRF